MQWQYRTHKWYVIRKSLGTTGLDGLTAMQPTDENEINAWIFLLSE